MQHNKTTFNGLKVILVKELQDFTGSARMVILTLLILLTTGASMYVASGTIRSLVSEDTFLLLSLFTLSSGIVPSFLSFMTFLVPLAGIALGFDTVNNEFQNRTLGRLLSQPIHRDVLLFGKALGALCALAIVLLVLWFLVIGVAMLVLGLPPTTEQIARAFMFYFITLFYGMIWFCLAMIFSLVCRQPATSALISIGIWLFLTVFWPLIAQIVSIGIGGYNTVTQAQWESALSRISPNILFTEASVALLSPSTRALKVVLFSQLEGAMLGNPLPLGQSVLLIWPHISAFVAGILLLFTLAYVVFQRQEIRA